MKYLRGAKIDGKSVLLRLDLNEPLENGILKDDFRIQSSLPTILKLLSSGCKIIIVSHLGRPGGKLDTNLSLRPIAIRLSELLKFKFVSEASQVPNYDIPHVVFLTGSILNARTRHAIAASGPQNIIFLENIRFYQEEETNDPIFIQNLAELGQIYINDAFSVAHHKSSSIVGVARLLPKFAGMQLEKEILQLNQVLHKPINPFVVMMGGIKISEKISTLKNLGKHANHILLGGGLANLIFLARGMEIGLSKVEEKSKQEAWQLDQQFKDRIQLPIDVVVADEQRNPASIRCVSPYEVKKREMILDIGPKTILRFAQTIKRAKTLVWNGPLGFFEEKPFSHGSFALAKIVGAVSRGKCFGVAGGGETVEIIRKAGQSDFLDHLSTGGGAMLEFLAGEELPGIKALE